MVRVIAVTLALLGCATPATAEDRAGWAFVVQKAGQQTWVGGWTLDACGPLRHEGAQMRMVMGPCLRVTLGEPGGGGMEGWAVILHDGFLVGPDPHICELDPPDLEDARHAVEGCPRASLRLPI